MKKEPKENRNKNGGFKVFNLGVIMQNHKVILNSLMDILSERDKMIECEGRETLNMAIEDFMRGTRTLLGFIESEVKDSRWLS